MNKWAKNHFLFFYNEDNTFTCILYQGTFTHLIRLIKPLTYRFGFRTQTAISIQAHLGADTL